jgi:hypothetical protein
MAELVVIPVLAPFDREVDHKSTVDVCNKAQFIVTVRTTLME